MKDLRSIYYDDKDLENFTLDSFSRSDVGNKNQEDDIYVKAKVGTKDSPLFSKKVCRVMGFFGNTPLTDESVEKVTEEEVEERMPRKAVEHLSVPSLRGEYLEVVECSHVEYEFDGSDKISFHNYYIIPVEYVIETYEYNEAINEINRLNS